MNYYPFHLGDYASHTAHLEPLEDLAYRRMLDAYYLREAELPADPAEVARLIRMRQNIAEVETVLREFFQLTDDGWFHARCSEEIDRMQDKQTKARASAAASVNARRAKAQMQVNDRSTDVQRTFNDRSTNAELPTPTPVLKEEKKKTLSGKPDAAAEILDYLNERAGKHFRSVKATVAQINARLREASAEEIRAVIDDRVRAWGRDEKMAEYLRPATLFAASNFANYLGNLGAYKPATVEQRGYFQGVRIAA